MHSAKIGKIQTANLANGLYSRDLYIQLRRVDITFLQSFVVRYHKDTHHAAYKSQAFEARVFDQL